MEIAWFEHLPNSYHFRKEQMQDGVRHTENVYQKEIIHIDTNTHIQTYESSPQLIATIEPIYVVK